MKFRATLKAAAAAVACLPAVAWADPVSLTLALTTVGVNAGYLTLGQAVLLAVGANVYGSARARREKRRQAAAATAARQSTLADRTATVYSATPDQQHVYGRCTVPGTIVAKFHSDKSGVRDDGSAFTRPDGNIHWVVEWAHHQSRQIHEVYIDGVAVGPTDGSGNATSGDYYVTRVDTRHTTIAGTSFVDVTDPVIAILNAWFETSADGTNTDVTPTLSLGNTRITNPSANVAMVDYTVQANRSVVRVNSYLGTSTQTVDAYLNSVRPTEWDSSHRLRGRTYSVITLDQEDKRFAGGNLPLFQADISGKLVYDPRTGLTAWSDNPALCLRDWLTHEYGYNCVAADIADAYTIASANACDVLVSIDDGAGPYTAAKYTCNGVFTTGQAKEAVKVDLEECMAGHAPYGAQYMIQAGYWTAPVVLPGGGGLTDDDLDGQIGTVQSDTPMGELLNGQRGTYVPKTVVVGTGSGYTMNGAQVAGATSIPLISGAGTIVAGNGLRFANDDNTYVVETGITAPGTVVIAAPGLAMPHAGAADAATVVSLPKSAPTDIRPPYANSTFVAADGVALWGDDIALPFTNTGGRARNIARILVERSRNGQIISYPAKLRAITLRVGDRITVNSTEYGFVDKVYRVTDRKFGLTSPVMLTLQEDVEETYDEADAATSDPSPNTRLPNPWLVVPITGLAATSSSTTALKSNLGVITPRVSVTWTAITSRYVIEGGHIEVLWRYSDQPWVQMNLPGDSTGTYIVGPKHDDRIVIEVRAVNGLGKQGPSAFLAHTVGGSASIGTVQIVVDAATETDKVEVNTDTDTFAASAGLHDRTFSVITVVNSSASDSVAVEVAATGFRQLAASAGLVGTATLRCWVSVFNSTDSVLVGTTQDYIPNQLTSVAAGVTQSFFESTVFNVTIAAGKTYTFTSFARVINNVASTGNNVLTTQGYTLRVAKIKR